MEESINTQITSEKFELEDGNEISNSTERLVITKGGPKVPSRYLCGRIASCHDACKYGIQHGVEVKPWSAAQKKVTTRGRKTKVSEEIVISSAGTKSFTSSSKPSLTSKFEKPNCSVVIKEVVISSMDGKTISSEKNLPPFEETDVSMENSSSDLRKAQSERPSFPFLERSNSQTNREVVSDLKKAQSARPSLPEQECSNSQTSREIVKSKGPFGSGSKNKSESRSKQMRTSLIGNKKISVQPSNPLSSENNVKKSSSITSESAKNLKGLSNRKNQKNVEKLKAEPTSDDDLQDKILHVIEPTLEYKSTESTLARDPTNSSLASPSLSGDKILKQASEQVSKSGSPASSKKSFRRAGHGIRPNKFLASSPLSSGIKGKRSMLNTMDNASSLSSPLSQSASSRRTFRHANHGIRPTKSLTPPLSSGIKGKRHMKHVMHSASSSLSLPSQSASPISLSNSSLGKQNGAASKLNKTGHGNPGETVKVGYKIRVKRSAIIGAGNKVIPARKLTFRRGKVIEHQPQNNTPRRLRFRPARLLSDPEREKIDTRKWSIRRNRVDEGETNYEKVKSEKVVARVQVVGGSERRNFRRKVVDGNKIGGSESGSEQVVLRHQNQNAQGKKVGRRLYNNVIEETASKLAELRQSKVKALVGAFETVISLDSPRQEASPLEISTTC